jgi:hypothetical protein
MDGQNRLLVNHDKKDDDTYTSTESSTVNSKEDIEEKTKR